MGRHIYRFIQVVCLLIFSIIVVIKNGHEKSINYLIDIIANG